MEPKPAELEAFLVEEWHRRQIMDTLLRYCRGLDRKNFQLVRSAYHDDAVDDHGGYHGDIPGLITWMRDRHRSVEQCMHACTNTTIERAGDAAVVESYCISYQRHYADGAGGAEDPDVVHPDRAREQIMAVVRFVDHFERRESAWRIAYRKVAFEAAWTEPVTTTFPPPGWTRHRRDERDALWAMRAEVLGRAFTEAPA
jgi:hypothetical protein